MLLVDDLAAGGTKNLRHTPRGLVTLYSNYSLTQTLIVATIVLLEINRGSEHRYSSRLSGSLLLPYLTRWVQDLSVTS